ncbi:DUF3616 domain-containing protein [Streptomyces sp. NBC_01387]|uniref:DUF3616 domain-containing protein n=1 Tax=unclassified Streptomyces TaxID=2593676 RepID=UPI002023F24C|nr:MULTISPECIES: DUF3616 domain-containing protein [unclassified Streptomyces]MCX4551814.1 DUF3616 domain-containing protein [Streptomyces sp. NBC_01500]WSC23179.1 DUF3616 domain-containing protein [Streptomyces sp. NBC_01766]WSV57090.1 DUF3616 domain-containing protein [Streptomyces sp. NBC_01014]
MLSSAFPSRRRTVAAVAAASGLFSLALGGLNAPAHAASYGTPTLSLSAGYLSGAVGATGDPTVTVTVAQSGADASALTVAASASSKSSVAGTGDVAVTGTGGTRRVTVTAHGQGYTDLTLKVTGLGGKTATRTLHYAASAAVQHSADTRYFTGSSDASAAVSVGDGYLVVADDESNTLRLYDGSVSGAPVKSWDVSGALGADKEIDMEAAARVGDTIYWTGSLGNNKDGKYKPDRNRIFTTRVTGSGAATELKVAGSYPKLRDDLVAWDRKNGDRLGFAAGTEEGQVPKQIDGFNIEGLEFAPGSTTTAYLGFRAPLVPPKSGGKALIVPVTDMDEVVTGKKATFGEPIELDLGGLSVRDIRKNAADQYLIVAGSWAADDNEDPYVLYSWDGVAGHAPVKRVDLPTSDPGGWEAVVDVPDLSAAGARAQLITDDGSADLYGDGTAAKDLTHDEWKKSRATWFSLNP